MAIIYLQCRVVTIFRCGVDETRRNICWREHWPKSDNVFPRNVVGGVAAPGQ